MTVPLLVRAARREPVERTPVWFMRQAGRSLPEYRALRERHSFWKLARTPELCAEITLQPVRRHDVDAAVIFADIMTPVLALGVDVELVEGVGPVVDPPLTDASELRIPEEIAPEVASAIRIVRDELNDDVAVIGFCGGPFTVAGYLVEGRPSRDFTTVKSFIHSEPDAWHALMDVLAGCFVRYVREQAAAGADVIQLFDSWAGVLSPRDYRDHVAPYSARVLDAVDVPTIHFGTSTAGLLGDFAAAGGDVIGLDWRIELDRGWDEVGDDRGVQGNLDPTVLLAPWEEIETAALDVLDRARGRSGHIFNLGHGVLPRTNPDVLSRLRELVHERTVEARV
jgi:uroporphyrinogen decarboxylase